MTDETTTTYGWPAILTVTSAAKYAQCSRWTVLRAIQSGDLSPAGKRGRMLTIERSELERWMRGSPVEERAVRQAAGAHARVVRSRDQSLARVSEIARRGGAR